MKNRGDPRGGNVSEQNEMVTLDGLAPLLQFGLETAAGEHQAVDAEQVDFVGHAGARGREYGRKLLVGEVADAKRRHDFTLAVTNRRPEPDQRPVQRCRLRRVFQFVAFAVRGNEDYFAGENGRDLPLPGCGRRAAIVQ